MVAAATGCADEGRESAHERTKNGRSSDTCEAALSEDQAMQKRPRRNNSRRSQGPDKKFALRARKLSV